MDNDFSPEDDLVTQKFLSIRQQAKKRNISLTSIVRPRKKTPSRPPRLGYPTGRDGRGLGKKNKLEGFSSIVNREITTRGWKKELAGGWIISHWGDVVGHNVASHTTIEMLKNKELHISCDSTAWATNLRYMQHDILQKIAVEVGDNVVVKLHIYGPKAPTWRHGPLHVKGRGPRDTYG
ncbi:DUF721 domain-containing protein [Corynebacterium sp. sy017]|uniref:DciA family protein n=1 Tax=unclassified Corynebacterium TaxID=2624378 RepID=UPI0011858697|nr:MULTISPECIES: DciA family protein [unclassified Corynebacterium]MBP3088271.1 DUF721 domain-containing protein [Corynebacterium sp. sy017]TSD91596.1 DUF721 domain-containing protein [Corynebacterium sp. SY003]